MSLAPVAIGNSQAHQSLRLRWQDGSEQLLDHVVLREQCPCSQCKAFRVRGMRPVVARSVRVLEIHPQGYGLQFIFSDGHQRGIYPWEYLAAMDRENTGTV